MASREAAARKLRPQEASPPVLTVAQLAKMEALAEQFLRNVHLSPDILRDLTEDRLLIKVALVFSTSEKRTPLGKLSPEDSAWLLEEAKSLGCRSMEVSGDPITYLATGKKVERLAKELEKQLTPIEQPLFGEVAARMMMRSYAELHPESDLPDWWFQSNPPSFLIAGHDIDAPETKRNGFTMLQEATIKMEGDRCIVNGEACLPLPLAAVKAQATEKNLRDWIKKELKFNGEPIHAYTFSFAGKKLSVVAETSARSIANRFIKWPSEEPAGPVIIGATKDKSGFIGMSEAANVLGISSRTVWLWSTDQEKAPPTDKPLEIIKCMPSGYFYIREKDVYGLKKHIPRSGLSRGRRPQLALS